MRKKIIKFKYFLFFSRIGQLLAVAVVLYFLGTGFSSAKNLSEISKKDAKILLDAQGIALPSGTATDSIAPTSKAPEVPNERLLLENQAVIERTGPPKTSEPSFISDYFARLTGSALSVFGERQFSIESSPELLFFNSLKNSLQKYGWFLLREKPSRNQVSFLFEIQRPAPVLLC